MLCSEADQVLQESSERVGYGKDRCHIEANRISKGIKQIN